MIIPVLALICIVLIVSIIVLYLNNQDKTCTHKGVEDLNAEYTTDEEGKCKFVRCKDTTYIQDSTGICVLDQSGQGCTPEGTPDANAIYETNVSNVCEFNSCIIGYEVGENDICIMAELEDESNGGTGGGSNGGTGGDGGSNDGTGGGSSGGADGGSDGGGGDPEPEVCLYTAKSISQGTRGYRWDVFLKADPSTGVFGGPFTALFSNPYTTSLIYPTENNLGKQFDVKQLGSGFQICNDGDESTESDTVNCQNYLPDEAIISTAPSDATRYYVAQDHATHGMSWGSYIYIPGHERHLEKSGNVKYSHPPPTQSAIDCEYSIWVDYTGVGNISKKIGRRS